MRRTERPSACSLFAGYEPATELVRGLAELNDQGYILTDRSQKTTADGLYAAGDVCVKPLRQVVTAVGDGALAATELEHLCAAMQEKTGIHPKAPVSRAEETAVSTETNSTLFYGGHAGPAPYGICPDGRSTGPAAVSGRNASFG